MTRSCPTSTLRVGDKASRLYAFFVFSILVLYAYTGSSLLLLALAVDFLSKTYILPSWSPFSAFSRWLLSTLNIKDTLIDGGPKLFAAKIGFFFSVLAFIFSAFNMPTTALVLVSAFGFCAGLEAFFGYCVGCKMYSLLMNVREVRPTV